MPKTPAANTININPSVLSFKPRQVLLTNPKLKPKMNKASVPALKPEQKALLLRSVAGYLKSNGFSKTLKKFLSEAQIEKDDISDSSLDLEHMYCIYLEIHDHGSTNLSSQKLQDITYGEENVSKKKKTSDDDCHAVVMRLEDSGKLTDSKETEKQKSKEKKKSKKTSDSIIQAERVNSDALQKPADNEVSEQQLHESDKKHRDKKKKKGKLDSESLVGKVEFLGMEGKVGTEANESEPLRYSLATKMVNGKNISLEDESIKVKGKKKKDGSVSKGSYTGDSKDIDERKQGRTESENDGDMATEEHVTDKERKGSKKRKRSTPEENNSEPIDKKEVDESKRRKTEGSDKPKDSGRDTELNPSMGTNEHSGKEIKGESDQVSYEKNGEKSAPNKSTKKQVNGSAEPTSSRAFQRVKVEEVVFIDKRLKDNSYWAKDGAEIGYGAKAEEVLGQVRGRDFRHEKTKKKRGSYRGGQIDLQSHSIKFNYSDED